MLSFEATENGTNHKERSMRNPRGPTCGQLGGRTKAGKPCKNPAEGPKRDLLCHEHRHQVKEARAPDVATPPNGLPADVRAAINGTSGKQSESIAPKPQAAVEDKKQSKSKRRGRAGRVLCLAGLPAALWALFPTLWWLWLLLIILLCLAAIGCFFWGTRDHSQDGDYE